MCMLGEIGSGGAGSIAARAKYTPIGVVEMHLQLKIAVPLPPPPPFAPPLEIGTHRWIFFY